MDIKLVDKLNKALSYERLTYGKLLSLGEKKTEYLVKNDTSMLSGITEEENQLIDQTRQLGKVREQLVATLCGNESDATRITLEVLKQRLPKDQATAMGQVQAQLKETVMKLAVRNSINQRLIENALKYINFNMEIMTAPSAATPTYGKSGEEVTGLRKRSVLDIKY